MRAVVQKVSSSKVTVDGEVIGQINQGLLVLLGVTHDDTSKDVDYMVDIFKRYQRRNFSSFSIYFIW